MDIKKLTSSVEMTTKSADILQPISEIANIISNEYLKKVELNEYCKIIESDLNKFQRKIHTLASDKNESARVKAEYKSRNKINITNSKSFRQALNELYKYKAELKSSYLAIEKALKFKKIKYKKIISAYDSSWKEVLLNNTERTLFEACLFLFVNGFRHNFLIEYARLRNFQNMLEKKYNSDPVFLELLEIQQENTLLERKIESQEKLIACVETEFIQMKENIEKAFSKKIIEFSKAVIEYKEFLNSQNRIKEDKLINAQDSERSFEFKLFRTDLQPFKENSLGFDNNDETNITCIDISMFDNIMVPSENLESQNLEDDGYSFMQNEGKHLSDDSKDQDEDLEYLNDYPQKMESQNRETTNPKGNLKDATVEENESQYFKQQALELQTEDAQPRDPQSLTEENFNKQSRAEQKSDNNLDGERRKSNSINNKSSSSMERMDNEDLVQMECEESISEGSYGNQKENYECQYQKTSSVSSDDLTSFGDNQNESAGPSLKFCGDEQNNCLKPRCETEKNDLKSFTGFFTMGNDHEALTPSIFKLF